MYALLFMLDPTQSSFVPATTWMVPQTFFYLWGHRASFDPGANHSDLRILWARRTASSMASLSVKQSLVRTIFKHSELKPGPNYF